MTNTTRQLDQFRQFALARLQSSGSEVAIDELYDEWRLQEPDPQEINKNAKAIEASLRDLERGVQGKPKDEFVRHFKTKQPWE
jgi:hypothetical protein